MTLTRRVLTRAFPLAPLRAQLHAAELPAVSVVLVTRNRSPYRNAARNPLTWALQTLAGSLAYLRIECVVVDDASTDHTAETLDRFSAPAGWTIRVVRNRTRQGCSQSRNTGVRHATHELVFFGDDDCLFLPESIAGAVLTLQSLGGAGNRCAVINLPVYERDWLPRRVVPAGGIGRVELDRIRFTHEFDALPEHALQETHAALLRPLRVQTFKGVNLTRKHLLEEAGGYPDLSAWENDYTEHLDLSVRMRNLGMRMYHQPDPRLAACHLKYGAASRDPVDARRTRLLVPGLARPLQAYIRESRRVRTGTGCRLSDTAFHENEIGTLVAFYLRISRAHGLRSARKEYGLFVKRRVALSTTPSGSRIPHAVRRRVWLAAIVRAAHDVERTTGTDQREFLSITHRWYAQQERNDG